MMSDMNKKTYRLPFLGGILTGIGFGLFGFPVLIEYGFFEEFGMMGVLFLGIVFVMVGTTLGLPHQPVDKDRSS